MRRWVIIAPELLSEPGQNSFIQKGLVGFHRLGELGSLSRVASVPRQETPESLLLGISPGVVELRQGPLTVSSLGFDPPERSTHFHLSLLSATDGTAVVPSVLPRPGEIEAIMAETPRLNSKLLTTLVGERFDHGLVWETLGDLGTTPPTELEGKNYEEMMPEGDGESQFRRYIDDSVNLLSSLEVNVRRQDEGLPPFNLLWPWGHGRRAAVPNLALVRGEPTWIESPSMRLAGLTRLAGYRHVPRSQFGEGLQTKFTSIRKRMLDHSSVIVYLPLFANLRRAGLEEEMEWAVREFSVELLEPLLKEAVQAHDRLALIMPGPLSTGSAANIPASDVGLSVGYEPRAVIEKSYPVDERSLEERTLSQRDLPKIVASALSLPD